MLRHEKGRFESSASLRASFPVIHLCGGAILPAVSPWVLAHRSNPFFFTGGH